MLIKNWVPGTIIYFCNKLLLNCPFCQHSKSFLSSLWSVYAYQDVLEGKRPLEKGHTSGPILMRDGGGRGRLLAQPSWGLLSKKYAGPRQAKKFFPVQGLLATVLERPAKMDRH